MLGDLLGFSRLQADTAVNEGPDGSVDAIRPQPPRVHLGDHIKFIIAGLAEVNPLDRAGIDYRWVCVSFRFCGLWIWPRAT